MQYNRLSRDFRAKTFSQNRSQSRDLDLSITWIFSKLCSASFSYFPTYCVISVLFRTISVLFRSISVLCRLFRYCFRTVSVLFPTISDYFGLFSDWECYREYAYFALATLSGSGWSRVGCMRGIGWLVFVENPVETTRDGHELAA